MENTIEENLRLCQFRKADLIRNADIMGYDLGKGAYRLKKDELINVLVKSILDDPKCVLMRLPEEDLMLLDILADKDPGMSMKAYQDDHLMAMTMLGLAIEEDSEDEPSFKYITIADDFLKAAKPHIKDVLNAFEVKLRIVVETIIIGALNLYGLATEKELKKILKVSFELTDNGSGMFKHVLANSVFMRLSQVYGYLRGKEQIFYISPFVLDFDAILTSIETRKEIAHFKPFSVDDFKAAGGMPTPYIANPQNDKLEAMLRKKLGFDDKKAQVYRHMLWVFAQDDRFMPAVAVQMLLDATSASSRPGNIDELNDVIMVLNDFLNSSPRWIFRGRSPHDMMKLQGPLQDPPNIKIGPNMQSMGYKQEDVQRTVDEMWEMEHASHGMGLDEGLSGTDFQPSMPLFMHNKVGRNEPCPCGSGKKYKNCHGRDN